MRGKTVEVLDFFMLLSWPDSKALQDPASRQPPEFGTRNTEYRI